MERFFRRALLVLFAVLLITGAATCMIFQHNLKEKLRQESLQHLTDVKADLDAMLAPQEKYRLIDTDRGYLARLRSVLLTGHASTDAETQSLSSALRFLKLAKTGDGAVHSIYVALLERNVPYILSDSGLKYKKFLRDRSWLESFRNAENGDFCEFRSVSVSTADSEAGARVLTVYHSITSTHWDTGEQIEGCIVINYYLTPIMMQLKRTLPSSHSIYIYEASNGQHCTSGKDDVLSEEELSSIAVEGEHTGEVREGEFVYFRETSDRLSVDYILLCPKKVLYQLVNDLNLAMILLAGAMLAFCLLFLAVYQHQNDKYLSNIRRILEVSNENAPQGGALRFPQDGYGDITRHILKHTVDRMEMKELLQKEQAKRMEMEMLALQSQINPHFLLNTVDFLYWSQVRDFGVHSGQVGMMENLCKILKYALDSSRTIVPLSDELKNAEAYIAIQKARKNLCLDVLYDIPQELERSGVMKLILQPVLENCFQHGLRRGEETRLRVVIRARREGEQLVVYVADDGLGMECAAREKLNDDLRSGLLKSGHIGIANINRRLRLYYGEDAGVTLRNNPGGGLTVILRMRYNDAPEPEDP